MLHNDDEIRYYVNTFYQTDRLILSTFCREYSFFFSMLMQNLTIISLYSLNYRYLYILKGEEGGDDSSLNVSILPNTGCCMPKLLTTPCCTL